MSETSSGPTPMHRLEYILLRFVASMVCMLPIGAALGVGAMMGRLAWKIFGVRRKIVLKNLRQAFPGMDAEELEDLGCRSYMNSGRFMVEFARQGKVDENYVTRYVRIGDSRRLDELRTMGGALLITGHFGNWELFGIACKYFLGDVAFLVGRQSNALVDRYINDNRSSHGIRLYNRRSAVKGVLESMRRGGFVCWLSDQDAGSGGIVVDFFGYPASTPRGAAAFSVKLGVPVIPAVLEREGTGPFHVLELGVPVYPPDGISGEQAEIEVTREYTRQLEEFVRKRPDLYWWAHRRWKSTGLYSGDDTGNGV